MTASSVSNRGLAALVLLALIGTAGILVPPSTVVATVESVAGDPVGFALIVVGLYLLRPLFALPTTPLAVVVGYGYGIALGVPIALVGVVGTVVPVFLVARWFLAEGNGPAPRASGTLGRLLERAERAVGRYYETAGPVRGVIASRLAPIPSDVATCAAAASDVRLRQLVVGTALGELPWTVAAVVVGASTATVATEGAGEPGLALAIACLGAAVLLLAGPIYRASSERPDSDDASPAIDG